MATPTKPKSSRRRLFIAIAAVLALVACCNPISLALELRIAGMEAFEIDGPSMAPYIQHGDRVAVAKWPYGLFLPFSDEAWITWGSPELGQAAVMRTPEGFDVVKRVVGMPGDVIDVRAGQLVRNGELVAQRDLGSTEYNGLRVRCAREELGGVNYVVLRTEGPFIEWDPPPVTVPPDHYFVLGDFRDRSNDSRNPRFGFVPASRFKGSVAFHYHYGRGRISCPSGD